MGVRLRLADVEPGPRIRRSAALQGRRLAPFLLLLDAARPRHARAARPHAGAGAWRGMRGHRLPAGAGPGAPRNRPPVGPRKAGGPLATAARGPPAPAGAATHTPP